MKVSSVTAGLTNTSYNCDNDSDIDITDDAGNLVIVCTTDWSAPSDDDVAIRGHIRIYGPDGDLIRYVLEITNNSDTAISDFTVETVTDFGSSGDIWGYQNVDETILAIPAGSDDGDAAAIEETDSNWIVNIDGNDPSGSLAWGSSTGSVDVALTETNEDTFTTTTDTFTVAAGGTVYLAYFTGWDPANLNTLPYADENRFVTDADAEANADAVVTKSAEFNSYGGRLAAGLPAGANVINWGPAPDLADTGADTSSLWAGLGLLIAGVAVVAVRRRARA
jgi:LPXTG-motif cell wall-anchored protein